MDRYQYSSGSRDPRHFASTTSREQGTSAPQSSAAVRPFERRGYEYSISHAGMFKPPVQPNPSGYRQSHGLEEPVTSSSFHSQRATNYTGQFSENGDVRSYSHSLGNVSSEYNTMSRFIPESTPRPHYANNFPESFYSVQQTAPSTSTRFSSESYGGNLEDSSAYSNPHVFSSSMAEGSSTQMDAMGAHYSSRSYPAQPPSCEIRSSNAVYLECTCGKRFTSRGAAKRHCESQTPSFECEVCHRYFTRKYNRDAHQVKCAAANRKTPRAWS